MNGTRVRHWHATKPTVQHYIPSLLKMKVQWRKRSCELWSRSFQSLQGYLSPLNPVRMREGWKAAWDGKTEFFALASAVSSLPDLHGWDRGWLNRWIICNRVSCLLLNFIRNLQRDRGSYIVLQLINVPLPMQIFFSLHNMSDWSQNLYDYTRQSVRSWANSA